MIATIILLMAQATPATSPPPPGLQFGFFRMTAFRQRVLDSNCGADLDALEGLRKRLAHRFGTKTFAWPKVPRSPAGDCRMVSSVFQVNFADFRKDAEAALAMPVVTNEGR